jgi:serine phosphatase RsbU (regulator of sigma subunit)
VSELPCGESGCRLGRLAQEVQKALLAAIHGFLGNAPQSDDITVMVVVWE